MTTKAALPSATPLLARLSTVISPTRVEGDAQNLPDGPPSTLVTRASRETTDDN